MNLRREGEEKMKEWVGILCSSLPIWSTFCTEFLGEPAVPNILLSPKALSPSDGIDCQWVDVGPQAGSPVQCPRAGVFMFSSTSLDQGHLGYGHANELSYFPSVKTSQVNLSMRLGFLSAFRFYVFKLSSNMHNCYKKKSVEEP